MGFGTRRVGLGWRGRGRVIGGFWFLGEGKCGYGRLAKLASPSQSPSECQLRFIARILQRPLI